jgi:tetratricopeptide (TPR) repeat protein
VEVVEQLVNKLNSTLGAEVLILIPLLPIFLVGDVSRELMNKVTDSSEIFGEKVSDFSEKVSHEYLDSFLDTVNDVQIFLTFTDEEKENIFVKRSLAYAATKNYKFLQKSCMECLKLNPKNYTAHYFLSVALNSRGNHVEALEHANLALEYHEIFIPFELSQEYEKITQPKESNIFDDLVKSGKHKMNSIGNFFTGKKEVPKLHQRIVEKVHISQLIGMTLIQNEFYDEGITFFEKLILISKNLKDYIVT